ncbi:MAG: division/cell wall cluster transcriptional repressor MraZ [Dehalococcoidia bacterium]
MPWSPGSALSQRSDHPVETAKGGDVHRDFFSNAAFITPDGQGRIQLPDTLIAHAGLDREVRVVGTGSRLEIWDRSTFQAREPQIRAARLAAMGGTPGSEKNEAE